MSRHRFQTYLDKVFDAVFPFAAMQIPSLLRIEAECCGGTLAKRIGPIRDGTTGYALQRESPEWDFTLTGEIARRLKCNGVLRPDGRRVLVVAAVDGVGKGARGQLRTDIQYYHRIVAVVIVSTRFPIAPGIRFQK